MRWNFRGGDGELVEMSGAQRVHARAERTDARKHDGGGIGDECGVGGETGIRAGLLERLLCRSEVADPVVEDGDERPTGLGHSTPLVDGTLPPSMRTASRSERATPLKVASMR